jgi:diacylglycerol O-acyltransferase
MGAVMKQLSGLDGAFLSLETSETPMNIGSLHLYDLPQGHRGNFFASVKRHVARRMHLVPIFHRKLVPMPLRVANPVWVEDDEVDLDYHVRRLALLPPGSLTQLEACVARLHSTLLSREHPLWEFYVIEGLATGQVAFYAKVHHAALDGAAGLALLTALLDITAQPRKIGRRKGSEPHDEPPGAGELFSAALRKTWEQYGELAHYLPGTVKTAARSPLPKDWALGPKTPLNVAITGERSFATLSLPLEDAKRIADRMHTSLNDVILAICSGGLRCYLDDHGGIPDKPLIAAVPISLRRSGDTEMNTQATMTLASLATHISAPIKRLLAIRDSSGDAKEFVGKLKSPILTDFPSLGIPWLIGGLASLYGWSGIANIIPPIANVIISNIHGPEVPLYLAGARMATYWPISIPIHGVALNITVESYCGSLDFGLTACRRALPDVRDLARYMADAHQELKAAVLASKDGASKATPAAPHEVPQAARRVATSAAARTGAKAKASAHPRAGHATKRDRASESPAAKAPPTPARRRKSS